MATNAATFRPASARAPSCSTRDPGSTLCYPTRVTKPVGVRKGFLRPTPGSRVPLRRSARPGPALQLGLEQRLDLDAPDRQALNAGVFHAHRLQVHVVEQGTLQIDVREAGVAQVHVAEQRS